MKLYFKIIVIIIFVVKSNANFAQEFRCGTDEYFYYRALQHPEILVNKQFTDVRLKKILADYLLTQNKLPVPSYEKDTLVSKEEELKKVYYDKMKLQKQTTSNNGNQSSEIQTKDN